MRNTYTSGEFVGEGGGKQVEVMKERKRKDESKKDESNYLWNSDHRAFIDG